MQTTLENLGQLERRLNVAVPLAHIEGEVAEAPRAPRQDRASISGFRPGKVPLKMVAQQYGPQVRSDVISDAVNASFNDAVREQNLRVAGYPRIEPRRTPPPPDALEFSAIFEVYPEVAIGDVVDDRDRAAAGRGDRRPMSTARSRCCASSARRSPRSTRPRRPAIACRSTSPARSTASSSRAARRRISRSCSARAACCPSSRPRVTGMKAGETRTFDARRFPADYHGKEVAGKQAQRST